MKRKKEDETPDDPLIEDTTTENSAIDMSEQQIEVSPEATQTEALLRAVNDFCAALMVAAGSSPAANSVEPISPDVATTIDRLTNLQPLLPSIFPQVPAEVVDRPRKKFKPKFVPFSNDNEPLFVVDEPCFCRVDFEGDQKRSVNPFSVESAIEKLTGHSPKRLFSIGGSFIVEVSTASEVAAALALATLDGFACTVTACDMFNHTKALIYIRDFNIKEDAELAVFKEGLQESYKDIVDVVVAKYIKTRSDDSTACVVTFKSKVLPYSLYIPGERYDTRVYPYHNRPMMCKKCQTYGHTEKRCKAKEPTCKKCSKLGHKVIDCVENEPTCIHCQGAHQAGSNECSRHKRETTILKLQDEYKVSFRRAIQIERGENVTVLKEQLKTSPDIIDIELSEEDKKTFSPWCLQKCISLEVGGKPKNIRSINSTTFSVEVSSDKQSSSLLNLTSLKKCPITVKKHSQHGHLRGLVYLYEYNLTNFESYKKSLIRRLPIDDAVSATWIKSRNEKAKPILLTFKTSEVPLFINIPGEQALTRVYEYKNRPMMCKTCLEFGHTAARCSGDVTCRKCDSVGHSVEKCESQIMKCHHCQGPHSTGSRTCKEYKYEEELLSLQQKNKISKGQAKIIFNKNNPNFRSMNYAQATNSTTPNMSPSAEVDTEEPVISFLPPRSDMGSSKVIKPVLVKESAPEPVIGIDISKFKPNAVPSLATDHASPVAKSANIDEVHVTSSEISSEPLIPDAATLTEVVLQSPLSGRLYSKEIALQLPAVLPSASVSDVSFDNDVEVTRRMFVEESYARQKNESMDRDAQFYSAEDEEDDDRRNYEKQLLESKSTKSSQSRGDGVSAPGGTSGVGIGLASSLDVLKPLSKKKKKNKNKHLGTATGSSRSHKRK